MTGSGERATHQQLPAPAEPDKLISRPDDLGANPAITFAQDQLDRSGFGNRLRELVVALRCPTVIAVDAAWGEGKTTFARMWMNHMRDQGMACEYLDCFRWSLVPEPLAAITETILEGAEKVDLPRSSIHNLRRAVNKLCAKILDIGVRHATQGAVKVASDARALKRIWSMMRFSQEVAEARNVHDQMESYQDLRRQTEVVKAVLEAIGEEVRRHTGGPLVVILDELDRCPPDYAIKILERIKHFLDVRDLVVVLFVHEKQMEEVVRGVYGSGLEAELFLQKFVDLRVCLPKKQTSGRVDHYAGYNSRLAERMVDLEEEKNKWLVKAATEVCRSFGMSLRGIERMWQLLCVYCGRLTPQQRPFPPLEALLAAVRVALPEEFDRIRDGTDRLGRVGELLRLSSSPTDEGEYFRMEALGFLARFLGDPEYEEESRHHSVEGRALGARFDGKAAVKELVERLERAAL